MNKPSFLRLPILVVDDEAGIVRMVSMSLASAGFRSIMTAEDSREVIPIMEENRVGVVILDLQMPHVSGMEILQHITQRYPKIPVIVLTANTEVEMAVRCMKLGAFDYLVKPMDPENLISTVRKAQEMHDLRSEVSILRQHMLMDHFEFEHVLSRIITVNEGMLKILRYTDAISASPYPVLITGEPGTGRKLLARVIHESGGGRGRFVAVDVKGLSDEEFTATVFGRLNGALVEASLQSAEGGPATVNEGTLCIGNIDGLEQSSQSKLLRLIDEKQYTPLGSNTSFAFPARLVVTSSPDLPAAAESGGFSMALFHRLADHQIDLPPLRHRIEDLPYLLNYFVEREVKNSGREKPSLQSELLTHLMKYDFPGNIAELETLVSRALGEHMEGALQVEHFPVKSSGRDTGKGKKGEENNMSPLLEFFGHFPTVEETVDYLISEALKATGNNKAAAASLLQITRQTINRRLRLKK